MSEPRRPGPSRPPVRLRPVPPLDPPYADEQDGAFWPAHTHGQLALDLFAANRPDPVRPGGRALRPVPTRPGTRPDAPLPPAALAVATPEATRAAHRFVGTCLEMLNGYRSPGQLRPLLDPPQASELLAELARAAGRAGPQRRRSARPALRLRRLRVCEPRQGAVEGAAVLTGAAGHAWALALRLEHRRGRWLCTALRVL